jgi:Flp pilus assembly protein TadD
VFRIYRIAMILAAATLSPLASARDGFGGGCSIQGRIDGETLVPGESFSVQVDGMSGGGMAETAFVNPGGDFSVDAPREGAKLLRVLNSRGDVVHQEALTSGSCHNSILVRIPKRKRERPVSGVVSVSELSRKIDRDAVKQFEKGEEALRKQEFAKAESHIRRALEIDPSFAKAYTALGICYAAREDREKAVAEYQKALSIQDDYLPARINLAAELWNLKRYEEAEENARMVLKIDPTIDKARVVVGFSLSAQRKDDEALTYLKPVVSSEPQARLGVAEILARQGQNAEAIEQLKEYMDSGHAKNNETVKAWIERLEMQVTAAR